MRIAMCRYCGLSFEKEGNTVYCSPVCQTEARRYQRRRQSVPIARQPRITIDAVVACMNSLSAASGRPVSYTEASRYLEGQ